MNSWLRSWLSIFSGGHIQSQLQDTLNFFVWFCFLAKVTLVRFGVGYGLLPLPHLLLFLLRCRRKVHHKISLQDIIVAGAASFLGASQNHFCLPPQPSLAPSPVALTPQALGVRASSLRPMVDMEMSCPGKPSRKDLLTWFREYS